MIENNENININIKNMTVYALPLFTWLEYSSSTS